MRSKECKGKIKEDGEGRGNFYNDAVLIVAHQVRKVNGGVICRCFNEEKKHSLWGLISASFG